ncbi:MAG: hypothetical protein SGJ09_01380 [Phycisphaerae bacterium]|nr:hypothetical protein [Phycisphaerae bacterium]
MPAYAILRFNSYDDEETHLHCGDGVQDHLFCVLRIGPNNSAMILDNTFGSYEEAAEAWPEVAVRTFR